MNKLFLSCIVLVFFAGCQSPEKNQESKMGRELTTKPSRGKENLKSAAPGEYIVTLAKPENTGAIREAYGEFQILELSPIGNGLYLLKLKIDPGEARMKSIADSNPAIKAVQPNFTYTTQ